MGVLLTKAQRGREVYGQTLVELRGNHWRPADMARAVEAASLPTLRAAFLPGRGLAYTKEAAIAKVYAAEVHA